MLGTVLGVEKKRKEAVHCHSVYSLLRQTLNK